MTEGIISRPYDLLIDEVGPGKAETRLPKSVRTQTFAKRYQLREHARVRLSGSEIPAIEDIISRAQIGRIRSS